MLFRALLTAPLPLLVLGAQPLNRRQDTASSTGPGTATATPASTSVSAPPEVAFTLVSSNPTAFPLTEIVATPVTHTTQTLDWTYSAGQSATAVGSLAPPLPAGTSFTSSLTPSSTFSTKPRVLVLFLGYALAGVSFIAMDGNGLLAIASYPELDKLPATDSPEVKQWIQDVANSGITIPDITPTVAGGCATNPDRVGNSSICWWTCGQCTRETDITTCPDKLTWGLSFDDGPSPDTPRLLDYLSSQNLHTTFFVVGSRAISRQDILQAEYMQGHQLSVHTWSHPALTTLTNDQIIAELGWTAKVIKEITGVTPNTFRPPYGDIDDRVRAIGRAMGMTAIIWSEASNHVDNFDTNDWHIGAGTVSASGVIASFESILQDATNLNSGFIVLAHDLYQQSVDLAIGYILPDALARTNPKFKLMSIIECLGEPLANAYKETNNNSTNPPPTGINQSVSYPGASASASSSSSTSSHNSATNVGVGNGGVVFGLVVAMGLALLA
ncbi:chitin deacetylase [Serendipita sp. 398]|nr:chitin deacetylase [Serendipita sp. 398]